MCDATEHVPAWVTLLALLAINGYNIDTFRQTGEVLADDWAIAVALVIVVEALALLFVRDGWNLLAQTARARRNGRTGRHLKLIGALSWWIGGGGFVAQTAMLFLPMPSGVVDIMVGTIASGACALAIAYRFRLRAPRATE